MFGLEECTPNEDEDYYKILGCSETSTVGQIIAEYRSLALKVHPDKNPEDIGALNEFKKLNEARDILTDPEKKENYDKWRRSGLNISFKKWQNIGTRCHTTMHWAKPKSQTMIEGEAYSNNAFSNNAYEPLNREFLQFNDKKSTRWEPETNNLYGKFRNYEI